MWAIGADGQEARLSLALTVWCRIWCYLPSFDVFIGSVSLVGYREPNGVAVFVFVRIPCTMIMH